MRSRTFGLAAVLSVLHVSEGEVCKAEGGCSNNSGLFHGKKLYSLASVIDCVLAMHGDGRWGEYLEVINTSLIDHTPCMEQAGGCNCLTLGIDDDLEVWRARGGVKWEEFLAPRDRGQAIHYQIINSTLLRQEKCLFPAR
jgi:hypothetical protein